jgi:hypothetical protein
MRVSLAVKDKMEVRVSYYPLFAGYMEGQPTWEMEEYTCNVYTKDYTKHDSAPKTQWEKHKLARVAERPEKLK